MLKATSIKVENQSCKVSLDLELPCELESIGSADIEVKSSEHYDIRAEGEAFAEIKIVLTWPPEESQAE